MDGRTARKKMERVKPKPRMTRKRLAALMMSVYKGGFERKWAPAAKASEEIWAALTGEVRKR